MKILCHCQLVYNNLAKEKASYNFMSFGPAISKKEIGYLWQNAAEDTRDI